LKDRAAFDRMQETARRKLPGGPLSNLPIRALCLDCGQTGPAGAGVCPNCHAETLSSTEFWWLGVPERATSVNLLWAGSGRRRGADRPIRPPSVTEGENTVILIQEIAPRIRWGNFWRSRTPPRLGPEAWSRTDAGAGKWRSLEVGERWRISTSAAPAAGETIWEMMPGDVALGMGIPASLRIQRVLLSMGGTITFLLARENQTSVVARIPLTGRALARCEENQRTLGGTGASRALPPELAAVLPRILGRVEILGHPVFVETALPGSSPADRAGALRRGSLRRLAAVFLGDLHAATAQGATLDERAFEDRVGHYCDRLSRAFPGSEEGEVVLGLKERLRRMLEGRPWPLVLEHGDFHLGNCLFGARWKALTGVVDWDLGSPAGFPLLDLLHLLVTTEATGRLDGGTALRLLKGEIGFEADELIGDYMGTLGLPGDSLEAFVRVYILVKLLVTVLVREGESRDRWRREVALPTLRALREAC